MATPEQDNVVRRLRSLGSQPVEPGVADRHVSYLAAAAPPAGVRSRMRPLMAGALLAGAVLGGTGLAAALPGSLPEQAGSVAKSALAAVNLVDDKPADRADKAAGHGKSGKATGASAKVKVGRFTEGCTAGTPPTAFTGNHGQYVKAHPDDPATVDVNERQLAAESDCGKPLTSLGKDDAADDPADATKPDKAPKPDKATKPEKAEDDADEATETEGTGRPESSGKSEEEHPPTTAAKEQGSEHPTDGGNSGSAGKTGEHRPGDEGPPTSAG